MADLNQVNLIGRLTRDPQQRGTPNGNLVASFGIATGRKFKGQDGQQREETCFVDIEAWGRTGDAAAKYLSKGRLCFISGRLKFDSWDDKQTGQKRSKLSVIAENIQFLERSQERTEPHVQNQYDPPQYQEEAQDYGTPPF